MVVTIILVVTASLCKDPALAAEACGHGRRKHLQNEPEKAKSIIERTGKDHYSQHRKAVPRRLSGFDIEPTNSLEWLRWDDSKCNGSSGNGNVVFMYQLLQPKESDRHIAFFRGEARIPWRNLWHNVTQVFEKGNTDEGASCTRNVTDTHPFDIRTRTSSRTFKGISQVDGELVIQKGRTLPAKNCNAYNVTVRFQVEEDIGTYRSCNDVPEDGKYTLNQNGTVFETECKEGFMRISRHIARNHLHGDLRVKPDDSNTIRGFLEQDRPYSGRASDHHAHYDINIPNGFDEFYMEDFRIRSSSYLDPEERGYTSEIGYHIPGYFYTEWSDKGSRESGAGDGDFAFGSAGDDGPVASYGRIQVVPETHAGIILYEENEVIYSIIGTPSHTFRLPWGETGGQFEGWIWWSGYIWVRNSQEPTRTTDLLCSFNVNVTSCRNGTIPTAGEDTCIPCEKYEVSKEVDRECARCPNGTVPNADQSLCMTCKKYEIAKETDTECSVCPNGSIPSANQSTCMPCEKYEIAKETDTECSVCPNGSIPNLHQFLCEICNSTSVASITQSTCTFCGPGSMPNTHQSECLSCVPGKFAALNQASCQECAPGQYSSTNGNSKCLPCAKQSYQRFYGQSGCFFCSVGRYQFDVGRTRCVAWKEVDGLIPMQRPKRRVI